MIIISNVYGRLKESLEKSDAEFNHSQRIRMKHIEYARQTGEVFIEIRDLLKDASKVNPLLTDMGTYTSFKDFLLSNGINKQTAYNYIDLAEGWDVVLRLGMQNADNVEELKKSMRICRTIKIIKWYRKALAAGRPEESLTLDQYWIDEEAAIAARRLLNQQEQVRYEDLAQQLREAHGEVFIANQKLKDVEEATKHLEAANRQLEEDNKKLRMENFRLKNSNTLVTT